MAFRRQRLQKYVPLLVRNYLREHSKNIDITYITISKDLSSIRIYCYWPDDINTKSMLNFLDQISPCVRKILATEIGFKKTPKVKFFYDEQERDKISLVSVMSKIAE